MEDVQNIKVGGSHAGTDDDRKGVQLDHTGQWKFPWRVGCRYNITMGRNGHARSGYRFWASAAQNPEVEHRSGIANPSTKLAVYVPAPLVGRLLVEKLPLAISSYRHTIPGILLQLACLLLRRTCTVVQAQFETDSSNPCSNPSFTLTSSLMLSCSKARHNS